MYCACSNGTMPFSGVFAEGVLKVSPGRGIIYILVPYGAQLLDGKSHASKSSCIANLSEDQAVSGRRGLQNKMMPKALLWENTRTGSANGPLSPGGISHWRI